jgi:hypothetical protein
MAASPRVTALIDELIERFNRRSLDLPDGVFTRHTQLSLNGVLFEQMHGRAPDDPLVLMLTRGVAGVRFTAKAIQHAMPDADLQRGELEEAATNQHQLVTGKCWMSGHLRGLGERAEVLVDFTVRFKGTTVTQIDAVIDPETVARLQHARLQP